jgi:tetratricopeptide (TPR) repeat protein
MPPMRPRHPGRLLPLVLLACIAAAPPPSPVQLLLGALQEAPDESTAAMLEARLQDIWQHQGSPAALLLVEHGTQALQRNAPGEATEDFDAALALEPDYLTAFVDRAAARLAAGDSTAALQDLAQALKREPHQFAALELLSRAAEARQDWKAALDAWQKLLAIDPKTTGGAKRLDTLREKAEGEPT